MNIFKTAIIALVMSIGLVAVVAPSYASADVATELKKGVKSTGTQNGGQSLETTIKNIVNVMLFIIGALSVVMIIVGGIRYVTSTGDSSRVKAAKDTVMYSVVGLLVALFAYAIVNFVVSKFA